jgi:hypothetical protein
MTAADLTDPQLDAAFAASFDVQDHIAAQYYGDEVRNRLVSVWSFIQGVAGGNRFPLYEARLGFSQSDAAQSSLVDSASNVAENIADNLKIGLGGLAIFALVAVGVYAYFGRK